LTKGECKVKRIHQWQRAMPDFVGILRVCHQIYQESALLPFALNTLSFASVPHLFSSKILTPSQRCAITSIHLRISLWYATMRASIFDRDACNLLLWMPSIRSVKVTFEDNFEDRKRKSWTEYLEIEEIREEMEKAEVWIEAWTQGGNDEVDIVFEFLD
jgi:hypothetical protein